MSRRVAGLLVLVSVFGVIALAGCGGGGGEKGTVAGYVCAPNGTDPAPGVLVFIVTKAEPPELSDYTDPDGYFEIGDVPAGAQDLQVGEGALAVTVEIDVVAGETNVVAPEDDPIKIGEGVVVKMAVGTGYWDSIETILGNLGFAELASPDDAGSGYVLYGTPGDSGDISPVLSDTTLRDKYDIMFLNCGTDETAAYDETDIQNLRDWVSAGHSLYVSDLADDFIQQGWPEAVTYGGYDTDTGTVEADVLDPALQAALGENKADITFDLGGWSLIESVPSETETLMRANVPAFLSITGLASRGAPHASPKAANRQTPAGMRPILVRFHPGQGTVNYTSFHNEAQPQADINIILSSLVFGL